MNDFIIWLLFLFVFMIIIGLYISEFTPLDLTEKEKILKLNYAIENFSPSVSSTGDQLEGASELYNWGLPDETPPPPPPPKQCHQECKPACPQQCPQRCPQPVVQNCAPAPLNNNQVCINCDITLNKDIDKYVLKSSVPACPDMSEFIKKNMMNTNPDFKDYILKSEIKPCEKVDITNYILKSQIPACPTCPICPKCPVCPVVKPVKQIHEYKITEHPDINNYVHKDQILNSDAVQNYIKNNCNKSPVNTPVTQPVKPPVKPPVTNPVNKPVCNTSRITEESTSELLKKEPLGYYVGDSLFAGV